MKTTIHIRGPAGIREARAIRKLHQQAATAQEELRAEYQRRADAMAEEFRVTMLERWRKLFALVDLPETEIGKWGLDARYLDEHGAAFLEKQEGRCSCGVDHSEHGEGLSEDFQGLLDRIVGTGEGRKH